MPAFSLSFSFSVYNMPAYDSKPFIIAASILKLRAFTSILSPVK
ncbi:hypothetical protein GPUN_1225 [Glaciecola punicea ACAM 611]|uniref:Uncharacterized protein n=1 Tax=Glaciecola punicea ACAM 611 TaxID=1121923 RepID=H5TAM2_9ALTE|nr:hypothetical protein GPUN_1225 [Glaciecola punicea ACAM 611]